MGLAGPISRARGGSAGEAEGDKIRFIFDGGTLTADQLSAIRLQPSEVVEYAFHDLAQADELLIPRLATRLAQALDARRQGQTRYLEHGATATAPLPN